MQNTVMELTSFVILMLGMHVEIQVSIITITVYLFYKIDCKRKMFHLSMVYTYIVETIIYTIHQLYFIYM